IEYLYHTHNALAAIATSPKNDGKTPAAKIVQDAPEKVLAALDADLNAPQALAVIAELAKTANEIAIAANKVKKDPAKYADACGLAASAMEALARSCAPLGLMQASAEEFIARTQARRIHVRKLDPKAIDASLEERAAARASKDFARADAIRKELL